MLSSHGKSRLDTPVSFRHAFPVADGAGSCRVAHCTRADFPSHEFLEIARWHLPLCFDGSAWKRYGYYLYHHHYLHSLWLLDTCTQEAVCLAPDIGREELLALVADTRPRLDLFLRALNGARRNDSSITLH